MQCALSVGHTFLNLALMWKSILIILLLSGGSQESFRKKITDCSRGRQTTFMDSCYTKNNLLLERSENQNI